MTEREWAEFGMFLDTLSAEDIIRLREEVRRRLEFDLPAMVQIERPRGHAPGC